ncbi:28478_t:CDS:2, partial [Racocetra persica]
VFIWESLPEVLKAVLSQNYTYLIQKFNTRMKHPDRLWNFNFILKRQCYRQKAMKLKE